MKDPDTKTSAPPPRANARGRAFLVQVSPDCEPGSGNLQGRVQHLDTADGGNFATLADLAAIVARILTRTDNG